MRCRVIVAATLLLSFSLSAHAVLDLQLTQGVNQATPIGVGDFAPDLQIAGDTTISQVIRNDLNNSGSFNAVSLAGNTNNSKLDNVLTGSVEELPNGKYKVNARLIGAYVATFGGQNKSNLLFDESYVVPKESLRRCAHKISDDVYQKLTGVRGVFSTSLAYVLVSNNHGQRYYTLELSDADGFNPRVLLRSVQPIMSPAWRPDGKHIYYVSFEGYRAKIYDQDLMTGRREVFSAYPGINGAPAVSPDGSQIALVLTKTGNPKIYLMDARTHALRQLTEGMAIDTEPDWSNDGKYLLFTSNRGGTPQIYKYNLANGDVERMTYQGDYNARARVMPNGDGFVMMHSDDNVFGIAKQQGSQCDVLVQAGRDESPSLAPNGQMIIYATQINGRGVLAMVSIDGNIKLTLPAQEGSVQEPAWSPFVS
jgi:TolB protein